LTEHGGVQLPGVSVMGNVCLPSDKGAKVSASQIQEDDDGFDSDMNSDMILLLKHVVDQK
jgi:hypothetical protein